MTRVSELKGASVFTSPKLLTPSGKPAKISRMRDITVPGKGTFQVGVLLRIRPTLEGGKVRYVVDWEQNELTGYAPSSDEAPMFTTRKIVGMEGTAALRETVVLDLGDHVDIIKFTEHTIFDRTERPGTESIRRHLFAILRFTTR